MTLTLELSDEQATALQAKAAAEGLSLEAWIEKLAEPQPAASQPHRHISEIIRENMGRVPADIMATMPADGASQHDHYIHFDADHAQGRANRSSHQRPPF